MFCGEICPEGICENCRERVKRAEGSVCLKCGKPVSDHEKEYCTECGRKKRSFDQGKSLYLHQGNAAAAVYRLKFQNQRNYAAVFAKELEKRYGTQIRRWNPDVLIPIPLHKKKRKKRGYNQAELLAEKLSEHTGIPLEKNVLKRVRNTHPQKDLDPAERSWNLRNAFAVESGWKPAETVLLVDDIYTTGSTIDKAAEILKKSGVDKVYFLSISIGQDL